jgi:hypothetical protein
MIGTPQTQLLSGTRRADETGIGRSYVRLDPNQQMVE